MNFLKISFSLLIFCFRVVSFGQAGEQTESVAVTPFGVDQGLRQSMVRTVIQDSSGLIWMTTGNGLHCFDGKEFFSFRVAVNGIYSHSDNLMSGMAERSPGVFTIVSSSSILQFNKSTGKFTVIYRREGSYPVLLGELTDNRHAVWLHDKKLCQVGDDRVYPQVLLFENGNEMPGNFSPKNTIRTKFNELLISGDQGIVWVNADNQVAGPAFKARWLPIANCQAVAMDGKGRVFILANGIIRQYLEKGKMKEIFDTRIRDKVHLFVDSRDNFWITGRYTGKQYKLTGGILKVLKFYHHDGKHTDSISPDVKSVSEDDHHNIWFGTDNNGVLLYSPGRVQFLKSEIGFTRCLAWMNNEIWAGTYSNGLWRISPDLSTAQRVETERDYHGIYYLDMAADRRGRMWVVTRHGVEVLDGTGHALFRQTIKCLSAKLFIHAGDTVDVFCDNWLYRFVSEDIISNSFPKEFVAVRSFLSTRDAWWVGNQFGLFRGLKSSGFDKNLLFVERNHLSRSAVYSILEHEECIWAATGNGIEIFGRDGKRKPLSPVIRELQNDVIYALLPDDQGKIWFTGNRGIGCINAGKDNIIYFNTQKNLQSLEFNSNAACRAPDGKIYFGGIRGINGFDPSWFNRGKKDPEIRLFMLSVGDTAYSEGIPPRFAEVILNRKAPHISGKVFCSDYTNAGAQLFSFYLDGYQAGWSKPSQSADFSYRDLPAGNYRLLVKCADFWQNWSEPVTLVSLTLTPPFWKTGWFLVVFILFIILTTGIAVRKLNSIRYTRRIHILEQQNAIEKERLRISKDMHDDLGASLTRISILSELAKKQQDDPVKSQRLIEQISDISGGVVDDMSEIIWAMNPRNDTLDSFTSYIRQYGSSYLESAGIDGHFSFPDHIPSWPMPSELRRNLFLTVKEALNNIVKHAGAGDVNMQLHLKGKVLHIVIRDNGKGFVSEKSPGWGNGLINMRKRMEESGGLFDIQPVVGKGTTIKLSANLPVHEKSH